MYRRMTPLIAALTLATLLGVPGISAADTSLGSLWSFLLKAGCMIDPSGHCVTGSTPASPDAGCRIDPDGRCLAKRQVTPKEGCRIDPNGACVTKRRVTPKEGCMIDPDGRCITHPQVTTHAGCMIDPNGRCKPGS
jgi:hypothetical protein